MLNEVVNVAPTAKGGTATSFIDGNPPVWEISNNVVVLVAEQPTFLTDTVPFTDSPGKI